VRRADIESFFKTLLLGDFEEDQNTAAQIVGGLISLIPILDQVMDARDISGALFRINTQGGFKNASADQLVNMGFAAFGAIPEVGSAFKTVFKPLWKERRAAKGAVNSGLQAIERLLGMRKGGAIAWVRNELLGKWTARTNQAIQTVTAALAACIELMEFIANASGWRDWLIPDAIQAMAKELLPGLKSLRGQVDGGLRRASDEIREFLADLLGEQAATVVMAVGQQAAMASAVPGTRTRAGHNAAATNPQGSVPRRQTDKTVRNAHEADAQHSAGPVHNAMQRTRKAFENLAAREKGLIGEHMVDYHELRRLGGNWPHDQDAVHWSPDNIAKLNDQRRKGGTGKGPIHIKLSDLGEVTRPGIDAVWQHGMQYTVTEAKASASIAAVYAMGKYKEKKGLIPVVSGLNPDQQVLHYLLSDSSDKGGVQTPLMQMGESWTLDRGRKEGLPRAAVDAIELNRCARRVVLATFESSGAVDHAEALADVHFGKTSNDIHPHTDHGITREWGATAIDAVDRVRGAAHESRRQAAQTTPSAPQSTPPKSTRSRRTGT